MILALVACLLIPHLVQSTPWGPPQTYDVQEPEFAAVIIGGCDKCRGLGSEIYSPNVNSSIVPVSPFDTCTRPAGVFYNDSLIVCGGDVKKLAHLVTPTKLAVTLGSQWPPSESTVS